MHGGRRGLGLPLVLVVLVLLMLLVNVRVGNNLTPSEPTKRDQPRNPDQGGFEQTWSLGHLSVCS